MKAIGRGIWAAAAVAVVGVAGLASPPAHAQWRDRDDQVVYCASNDGHFARCRTPWPVSELTQQLSNARCVYGETWGMEERYSVWVDRGCRANFQAARGEGGWRGRDDDDRRWRDDDDRRRRRDDDDDDRGGWRPGPDWDRTIELRCDSNGERYQMCLVDVGRNGRVRLVRRLSDARCEEGSSWGWNRAGVWVDQGCRAVFQIDRRW
jgi:hypothetical protein